MIIAIAIISLIGYFLNFIIHLSKEKIDVDMFYATLVVLAWWDICLPFAITMIVLSAIIAIIGASINE